MNSAANSEFSYASDDASEIKQLLVPKRNILRFAGKVKEIDRQYEANNNGELDNGVYHENSQDSEENKSKEDDLSSSRQNLGMPPASMSR